MDGGTFWRMGMVKVLTGLSPRGRGNRDLWLRCLSFCGSIPAWTGEPHRRDRQHIGDQVYPRVDGGTPLRQLRPQVKPGLSPRGRGNPGRWAKIPENTGSIPAWTGEPHRETWVAWPEKVYPRVDGGTAIDQPGVRGVGGLSPRGRGNPHRHHVQPMLLGSIPAWTGEPGRWRPGGR